MRITSSTRTPPPNGFRSCLYWEEELHPRLNHLSFVRQESRPTGKHGERVFRLWKWTKGAGGGGGGEGFGCDGWVNTTVGVWAEVLLLQRKCLPTRETPVRVLYRLRGAAKHEEQNGSLMQPLLRHKHHSLGKKRKKKKLQLRRTERHLFHKSWNWLRGMGPTAWASHLRFRRSHPTRITSSSFNSVLLKKKILITSHFK